ncbi:Nuclease S1 [Emericellopsis cladophorae]|uniref:Nuclease S1 n=1 Tax=Emericellopsis cladophorae TaxID=2686198 RepID=A0A9P9XU36_9HYPO|nr:Nuclease S1 [Emericellopsis cladophorae]KAI6777838.1 Nuclease S1 [Emericellopsis cladophorae]
MASKVLLIAATLPRVLAWGPLGHETVALVATEFVLPETRAFFREILGDNSSTDYLAAVASWADDWKRTDEGAFSYTYHFIDALDEPPTSCNVDIERDCGETGCVVSARANYTTRLVQSELNREEREIAAKLVIHFSGDIGQPLHCENLARGGNDITVTFDGEATNLHSVLGYNIPEAITNGSTRADAHAWAAYLISAIKAGPYRCKTRNWVAGLRVDDIEDVALRWARESNEDICTVVMQDGAEVLEVGDLAGEHTEEAKGTVNLQIAKHGYRLAKLLDAISQAQ